MGDISENLDESFSLAKLDLNQCDANDENAASNPDEGAGSLTSFEAKFQHEYEDEDRFINSVNHCQSKSGQSIYLHQVPSFGSCHQH